MFVFVFAGCAGGRHKAGSPNTAAFLTIMRNPLIGAAGASDADAIAKGNQACADLGHGMPSDDVVADLSGGAEPGSASFNSAAYILAAANKELCPAKTG